MNAEPYTHKSQVWYFTFMAAYKHTNFHFILLWHLLLFSAISHVFASESTVDYSGF